MDPSVDTFRQLLDKAAGHGPQGIALFIGLCVQFAHRAEKLLDSLPAPVTPKEPSQPADDVALSPMQSARETGWTPGRRKPGQRNGYSPRWFYDHADELPFRIGGKGFRPVRFSRNGLRTWLSARAR